MSLVSARELFLTPLVVLLEYVLAHVLAELQGFGTVDPFRRDAVPEPLKLLELLVKSLAHLHSSRPADLTPVYDLHGWAPPHHYVVWRCSLLPVEALIHPLEWV